MDNWSVGEYFKLAHRIANHFRRINKNGVIYSLIMGTNSTHANIHIIPSNNNFEREIRAGIAGRRLGNTDAQSIVEKYKLKINH